MSSAFDEENPKIKINLCESRWEKGEQKAFKNLAMGIMGFIRNPYTHGDTPQLDFISGFKILSFLSYLFEVVDNRP